MNINIVTCPYCDGHEIQRCPRRDIFDVLLGLLGRKPHVCASCHARFFLRRGAAVPHVRPSEPVAVRWQADGVAAVDCMQVNGAWVPAEPEPVRAPQPDVPVGDYICPPALASHLVNLLDGAPDEAEAKLKPKTTKRRKRSATSA
jgi:hypothetical protein